MQDYIVASVALRCSATKHHLIIFIEEMVSSLMSVCSEHRIVNNNCLPPSTFNIFIILLMAKSLFSLSLFIIILIVYHLTYFKLM